MDFVRVTTAAALLAWYALLEYEDRRRGTGVSRQRRAPEGGGEYFFPERRRGGAVALGGRLLSFPPFIFFAAALAAALTLCGRGPGLFALLAATLLSDFFFVEPAFVFSTERQVFRLSLVYLLGGVLSVFISRRLSSRLSA